MFKNKIKEQILILNLPVSWSNFNYIMVLICTIFLATTYTLKSNKIEILFSSSIALINLPLTWPNWSPTWQNLALADLVTNLTKPCLDLDKSGPGLTLWWNRPPPHKTTFQRCSEFQREELDWHYAQIGH